MPNRQPGEYSSSPLTGPDIEVRTAAISEEFDNGNSGVAATIDWNNGDMQRVTLTANCVFTFTDAKGAGKKDKEEGIEGASESEKREKRIG